MKLRKILRRVTSMCIILSLVASVSVFAFPDVDESSKIGKAIVKMQEAGYIRGFEDGTFRPDATLTRAEFVTIINKMYGFKVETENVFADVIPGEWYYKDVLCGVQAGYIKGHDDKTFRPNDTVTREQVCVMMNRILNVELIPYGKKITDTVSDWAKDSVEKLVSNRFFTLEEGGKFRALQPITRGETCEALEKCIVDVPIEIVPVDLENIVREELEERLSGMIEVMESTIIPGCTYEGTIDVAKRITESMKKYLEDENYDYMEDAKATYQVYKKLGYAKAGELKQLIFDNIETENISILFDFFYTPEIDS
ncbi:MAG: S-layer homology domain-containing protein [Ruminococcaceae bacterium]|nr:S-layer homology domain-containing protein [Oscillospiraceae bacterium]